MSREKGKNRLPKPSSNLVSDILLEGYMSALGEGNDIIKKGEYARAEELLTKICFEFSDGNFYFVLLLADAMFLQGKLEDAEILYRDLIEANERHAHSHHGLALILLKTKRAEEAEQHIRKSKRKPLIGKNMIPEYLPPLD